MNRAGGLSSVALPGIPIRRSPPAGGVWGRGMPAGRGWVFLKGGGGEIFCRDDFWFAHDFGRGGRSRNRGRPRRKLAGGGADARAAHRGRRRRMEREDLCRRGIRRKRRPPGVRRFTGYVAKARRPSPSPASRRCRRRGGGDLRRGRLYGKVDARRCGSRLRPGPGRMGAEEKHAHPPRRPSPQD